VELAEAALAEPTDLAEAHPPSHQICPTEPALVVADHDGIRRLGVMRWGWRRKWTPRPLFNARVEGLLVNAKGKPAMWREGVRERRCAIPATHWFEWWGPKGHKECYAFRPLREAPMFFAGCWESDGDERRFTVITRPAVPPLDRIHDRMPAVLLDGGGMRAWLGGEIPFDDPLPAFERAVRGEDIVFEGIPSPNPRDKGPEVLGRAGS